MKLHAKKIHENTAIFGGDIVFRFDKYEIVDGNITPTPDAVMTHYRPWNDFRPPEGKEPRRQPYSALLDLVAAHLDEDDDWRKASENLKEPSEGLKSAVLEWCARYGLFGMKWHPGLEQEPHLMSVDYMWLKVEDWPDRAEPDMRAYTEPLASFLELACRFYREIELLRVKPLGKHKHLTNVDGLRWFAQYSSPILRRNERGNLNFGWDFRSSTLAAFSVMAMLDLSNTRLLRCARKDCGNYFSTKAKKARFCSDRCRNTNQMRKYRKKLEQREKAK
jgi:hypothetical protein